ncbi:MAG: STAS/SEC14 domain-containing protein, partial [Actinobacteria bacterium]|nr:STAS/SEC14 domain-containing protein [Actinomycetota bacterium]
RNDFDKLAIVGGPEWVKLLIELDSILPGAEMKTFSTDQLQEAWDWIKS